MSTNNKNMAIYQNLPPGGASVIEKEISIFLSTKFHVRKFTDQVNPKTFITYMHSALWEIPKHHKKMANIINKKCILLVAHHTWVTKSPHLLRYVKIPKIYFCQETLREYYDQDHIKQQTVKDKITNFLRLPIKHIDYKNIMAKGTTIIANSKLSGKLIEAVYKVSPVIIYPGIICKNYNAISKKSKQKNNTLISIGRISNLKRFHFLIDVVAQIPTKKRPNLVILGNSGDKKYLELLKTRASEHKVRLTIKINVSEKTKIKYLHESNLFVYAPINEPFGIVVLEAMAAGLPIAVYKYGGGYAEIINKKNGLLFDNLDSNSWSQSISALLDNADALNKYGKYNNQYVNKHFDIKLMTNKVNVLIDQVLNKTKV